MGIAVLAAILFAGLILRTWGISLESAWFDEFTSIVFLGAPNLFKFLVDNRSIDPATMPLYYTFEYLWAHHVSDSLMGMRLLSVVISLATICVVYALGTFLAGRRAGLVAAACMALSPIHLHFGQEIRMYVMLILLAALSAWSFLHLVCGDGRKWWVIQGVANGLLMWTHPFAILLVGVEGLYLLVFHLKPVKRLAGWCGMHVVALMPWVVYVASIRFWDSQQTASWMKVPKFTEFIGDLIGDDALLWTYQHRATLAFWRKFYDWSEPVLFNYIAVFSALFVGLFMLGMVVFVVRSMRAQPVAVGQPRPPFVAQYPRRAVFFLLTWFLLPPLILYVLSLVWRPCIMPRYTVHCSIALYLMFGCFIATIARGWLRHGLTALLVLLFALQISFIMPGPRRTDWLGAGEYLKTVVNPADVVLVQDWMWRRVFITNLGVKDSGCIREAREKNPGRPLDDIIAEKLPLPISYAKSERVLAELSGFTLATSARTATPVPAVWAVIQTNYFGVGPAYEFEEYLKQMRLSYEMREFGGMQHVLVYRIALPAAGTGAQQAREPLTEDAPREFGDLGLEFWRKKNWDMAIAACRRATEIKPDYPRAWSYMGMALKEKGEVDSAIAAFERAVAIEPGDYVWSFTNLAELCTKRGDYDKAVTAARAALKQMPNYGWAFAQLGLGLQGKGDKAGAAEALKKAIECDPWDPRPKDFLKKLEEGGK
jgi:uncharacterized membrane protein/tetratricopeptide (TPR) repeat protein